MVHSIVFCDIDGTIVPSYFDSNLNHPLNKEMLTVVKRKVEKLVLSKKVVFMLQTIIGNANLVFLTGRPKEWEDITYNLLKPIMEDQFKVGIHGLSEDMEDFIYEQTDYYFHHETKFWSSFWTHCCNMWSNGIDLTNKQLTIIEREYNKVKGERIKQYKSNKKKYKIYFPIVEGRLTREKYYNFKLTLINNLSKNYDIVYVIDDMVDLLKYIKEHFKWNDKSLFLINGVFDPKIEDIVIKDRLM